MPKGLSIREFAKRDGCSDTLVRRKLKSGHLVAFADGTIDPALVGTAWRNTSPAAEEAANTSFFDARPDEDDPESIGVIAERILLNAFGAGRPLWTKAEAEQVKENYNALLRQLEYDRLSKAVADIDEFTAAVAAEYQLVKNRLFNIGARIAPRCAMLKSAPEIKALIDSEVTLALQELTLDAGGRGERAADT